MRTANLARALAICGALLACGCGPRSQPHSNGAAQGVVQVRRDSPGASGTAGARGWFEERAQASGIDFRMDHHGKSPLNLLEIIGAGCAAADLDDDGFPDVFLVGQTGVSEGGIGRLYRNRGDGTFEDVTKQSGIEAPGLYMGAAVGDIDNDGLPDLLLTGYGVVRLYKNLGHMRFKDITATSGLQARSPDDWTSSAAFFDYDRDGLLDLYICRYVKFNAKTIQLCAYGSFQGACGPRFYDPERGSLYRNLGNGRFKDVTNETGLNTAGGKCLGIAVCDVNNDGWPDFYLANDEMPGDLLINERGKRFRNVAVAAGVALSAEGGMQGGMGVDFADYNRDGPQDLFVTTFEGEADSLYRSLGGPQAGSLYEHASMAAGLDSPTRRMVGFGTRFVDVRNSGWPDIVIANGNIHDNQEQIDRMSHFRQPLQLFINQANGQFSDMSEAAGPGFTDPAAGRGLAIADFDRDGRMDILTSDIAGKARLLMNRYPMPGHWLMVKLRGTKSNRQGIGARVKVTAGKETWTEECTASASYMSASDPRLHFGLGGQTRIDALTVNWPSGRTTVKRDVPIDREIVLEETP